MKYYIRGERAGREESPFILHRAEFFEKVCTWCEQALGPQYQGWFVYPAANPTVFVDGSFLCPNYIVITNEETVTMLKLTFPNISIVSRL